PLLAKELTERAARKRTYVLRAVFGLLLVAWFAFEMRTLSFGKYSPENAGFAMMGIGQQLFAKLTAVLCWSILIFQPALLAGAITYEKERGSLELLMLTRVRPWK